MNSNLVFYRTYRPKSFDEVIGQESVIKALSGALQNKKVGHAYLFSGSRGTGKTSIARIFAKEIGSHTDDIYEIDAASNRGVDDIRALRDAVQTVPIRSSHKVYIIDEVHMLTKEAFNALLKTLEEPPRHIVFILATTDKAKLPETIISRCQSFHFSKPSHATLQEFVKKISEKEGYVLEPASINLIALLGDGSFRDTLGILQKVVDSALDRSISYKEVLTVIGAPESEAINNFLRAVVDRDVAMGLMALTGAIDKGAEEKIFLDLLLRKIRAIMMLRFVPDFSKNLTDNFPPEDIIFISDLAKTATQTLTSKELSEFLQAYQGIRVSAVPGLSLEIALLRITKN